MTAFNPVLTIGAQLVDFLHHLVLSHREKRASALAMLARVGIADPAFCLQRYAHELSGSTRQRAAIAAALLMQSSVLVADAPTTALDVTMEAQIIHLLRELRREFRGSILFVSHNLGLVAELCDEVVVMYAGEVIERGDVRTIFHNPGHPYTRRLLDCDPARIAEPSRHLPTIPGNLPDLVNLPPGCIFAPRCPEAYAPCTVEAPASYAADPGHQVRCFRTRDG